MEFELEKNLFLRITKFGVYHAAGFNYDELMAAVNPTNTEKKIIDVHIDAADMNGKSARLEVIAGIDIDTIFYQIASEGGPHSANTKYIIEYPAQFNYLDYLELQFARKTSAEARTYSIIAIGISTLALIASIAVPLWVSINMQQEVKLDKNQIHEIESLLIKSKQGSDSPV